MQPRVLKFILDIESIIAEIESIKAKAENNFEVFKGDIILQRATDKNFPPLRTCSFAAATAQALR